MSRHLDGILTVTEDEIARAMVRASREARLVLEPSGATALAAWLFHEDELPATGPVVCILSGGNVDPARYDELLARGVAAGG
jgi:threonine dehydratase